MLTIGSRAPEFFSNDARGRPIALADYVGKKNVVLFFYPKAFTPGCTAEVCTFRDAYAQLADSDTEVIGVSLDSDETQARFADAHRLPYPLIGDSGRNIARNYQVLGMLSGLLNVTQRVTYVIDKQGIIRGAFRYELRIGKHLEDVKSVLHALQSERREARAPGAPSRTSN